MNQSSLDTNRYQIKFDILLETDDVPTIFHSSYSCALLCASIEAEQRDKVFIVHPTIHTHRVYPRSNIGGEGREILVRD